MSDSEGYDKNTGAPNSGSAIFAPFEAWSEWLRNNMGDMTAPPGYWTGEEAGAVPEGDTASDPLVSGMGNLPDNPMSNIIPLDWMEISKALQTLHKRQMSDPQRARQVTALYNQRLLETTMEVWSNAASRLWG